VSDENHDGELSKEWAHSAVVRPRHQLLVDFSERHAAVLDLARASDDFDVQMVHLPIGDYFIGGGVIVERKTYADFATSLTDGRLFPQAATLARSPHRPVLLLEGPKPRHMPDVHPHALKGALVSPGRDVAAASTSRARSRRLHANLGVPCATAGAVGAGHLATLRSKTETPCLEETVPVAGSPRVGPALANQLMRQFGSIERVITAEETALMQIRGIGPKKAAQIRQLLR
jgi:DNA excision repair protein ERCC-4